MSTSVGAVKCSCDSPLASRSQERQIVFTPTSVLRNTRFSKSSNPTTPKMDASSASTRKGPGVEPAHYGFALDYGRTKESDLQL